MTQQFLVAHLDGRCGQAQIALRINKLGQPKLALERIKTIDVPLSPIDEQREMDAMIIEVDQTIDQARAELKALVSVRAASSDSLINGRISTSI